MPDRVIRWLKDPGAKLLYGLAAAMFAAAFVLASYGANTGLRDARNQVEQFQEQASCRSELAAEVNAARANVDAIDGQIIASMALTFSEALTGPLPDARRVQLQQIFRDQLDAREALQSVMDDALARQEQAADLCPG